MEAELTKRPQAIFPIGNDNHSIGLITYYLSIEWVDSSIGQSIFAGHTLKQKYNAMQRIVFNTSPQTEYSLQISVLSHAS